MPSLKILRLNEDQLTQVYPLVRAVSGVGAERWEAFARALIAGGGGVLAVEAEGACLHGVAAYRALGSLRHDLSLQVEILATFEFTRALSVRRLLCDALETVAREQGCRSIVFTMPARSHADPVSASRLGWEELGLTMESVSFVQAVRPTLA